jgi:diguanylate cyclase (GGDEF)-like protein/PAS domain S-box-containing protein
MEVIRKIRLKLLFCSIFILAITGIYPLKPVKALSKEKPYNILILNSYSNNQWTDSLNQGIFEAFDTMEKEYVTYTENMDYKRFPGVLYQHLLTEQFAYKYKNTRIDIILTTDDRALLFALEHRKEMFSDAPIIFSGVHKNVADRIMERYDRITGVYEQIDTATTIQYAKQINQNLKKVYLLSEYTETAIITEAMIVNDIHATAPELEIISLSNYTLHEILEIVPQLTPDSILLMGPYSVDKGNEHYGGQNLIKNISKKSSVPIYVLYEYEFGTGALGGHLLMGEFQGRKAGNLAIDVLNGDPIDDMKPVLEDSYQATFDYNALLKHDISLKSLPKDSIIINRDINFFERYRTGVIIVLSIFVLLILFIAVLMFNIRKRIRAEKVLKEQNTEIQQLYETVSISEEELKAQFDELWEIKNHLAISEERYRLVSEASNDIIWELDIRTNIVYFPERLFGFTDLKYLKSKMHYKELIGIIHPEDLALFKNGVIKHVWGETPNLETEMRMKVNDEGYLWFSVHAKAIYNGKNKPIRLSGCFTDITEKKKNLQMIEELAYYDTLTGMRNRAGFMKSITMVHEEAKRYNRRYAIIYFDLDNFKDLNDTFGHTFGDEVLVQVAQKTQAICDSNSYVARLGGDEFIMLLTNATDDLIHTRVEDILTTCQEKMIVQDRPIYISASIGVSIYPEHATDYETLIRYADIAMYVAKREGKMQYKIFADSWYQLLEGKVILSENVRIAIEDKQFMVYYQPQIDMTSGNINHLEALIRWKHPDRGMISPLEFISLAEETGQIVQLGFFVLRQVLDFLIRLKQMGKNNITVSINVSVKQLIEKDFVDKFTNMVIHSGIEPEKIMIELTESILMESFQEITDKLNLLIKNGFSIALDDFGTGYSSLSYLLRLPIQILKIDKSFIERIIMNDMSRSLIISIIDIAHNLGMKVVAEGVENKEEMEFLMEYDCDYIQGYLISRPEPEDQILKRLIEGKLLIKL